MISYRYDKPAYQLSALERAQQSKQDKQMGIFRKKKEKKTTTKPKTRVAEFDFKPGLPIHYDEVGRMWAQEYDKVFERMIGIIGEKKPVAKSVPAEYGGDKVQYTIGRLIKKYPGLSIMRSRNVGSDNVVFHISKRDDPTIHRWQVSNTFIASTSPNILFQHLEAAVKSFYRDEQPYRFTQKYEVEAPKKPTESWADEWARKNA